MSSARLIAQGICAKSRDQRFSLGPMSCEFLPGTLTAILGRNGAGKTTFLKSIAGLIPLSSGELRWGDIPLAKMDAHQRGQTVAWIQPSNTDGFQYTVKETLLFGRYPWHLGHPQAPDYQEVQTALREINITDLKDRRLPSLSSGELQKVQIARALASQAQILILDEPTANLDIAAAHNVMRVLKHLATQEQRIVIYSSHDLALITKYSDAALGVQDGQLTQQWSRAQLSDAEILRFFAL